MFTCHLMSVDLMLHVQRNRKNITGWDIEYTVEPKSIPLLCLLTFTYEWYKVEFKKV